MNLDVRTRGTHPVPLYVDGTRQGGRCKPPGDRPVEFRDVQFEKVDFSGTHFWAFEVEGSVFTACDFRKARLDAGHLGGTQQTVYRNCQFDGARLGNTDASFARFERCTFDRADLKRWRVFNAEFVECHFAGRLIELSFAGKPDPKHLKWIQPPRTINEFRGNDFRQAELIECSFFRGIDLNEQLLPEGNRYIRLARLRERINRARAEVARWPDDFEREKALAMLRYYDAISADQDQLFANRNDGSSSPQVRNRVWELLTEADIDRTRS